MISNSNFVSLDLERVKEIIKDRLKLKSEPHNAGVCTEFKNSISIFNDRLANLKHHDFYALVPSNYTKNESGKWVYDITNFKIYRITKDYIESLGIEFDETDYSKVTSVKLSDKILNYCSVEGLIEVENDGLNNFLNAKEFACLMLKIPKSGNVWLDALIKEANKQDFNIKI